MSSLQVLSIRSMNAVHMSLGRQLESYSNKPSPDLVELVLEYLRDGSTHRAVSDDAVVPCGSQRVSLLESS